MITKEQMKCPRCLTGDERAAAWAEIARRCEEGLAAIKAQEDALKPSPVDPLQLARERGEAENVCDAALAKAKEV